MSTPLHVLGFVELGAMALPMTMNRIRDGYSLRVYNRITVKADPLIARGATVSYTILCSSARNMCSTGFSTPPFFVRQRHGDRTNLSRV